MANLSEKKNTMPEQAPDVRNKNFDEVALGYSANQALDEAERCLSCKKPSCIEGCPVKIDIPSFISEIKNGDIERAYEIIAADSSLPAVCGRVCPQEKQCEMLCVRGNKHEPVAIGRLERYVADWHMANSDGLPETQKNNGHMVAIIGSGPAGLTCAGDLVRMGYKVTVFEALHTPGGVLVYGIPQFRLPKEIVAREIDGLRALGVEIKTNMPIGRVLSIDDIFDMGFEAVFIGSGAGLPRFMNIPGENLNGVYSANEYLTRINLMRAYEKNSRTPIQKAYSVAVVGGGNVAMDAARCAKRLGAEKVYIIYRRSETEMPARREEVHHAGEEGIIFRYLASPIEILDDGSGFVGGIKCVKMELGQPDASGRRKPATISGSEFVLDVDQVIIAVGTSPNPLLRNTTGGLEADSRGCLKADENGLTSRQGVYAGGDAVTGAATVILAMGAGKVSAKAIDKYIRNKNK